MNITLKVVQAFANYRKSSLNVIKNMDMIPDNCISTLDLFILQPDSINCMWGISLHLVQAKDQYCIDIILRASNYPRVKKTGSLQHFCITDPNVFKDNYRPMTPHHPGYINPIVEKSSVGFSIFLKKLWTLAYWLLENASTTLEWKYDALIKGAGDGRMDIIKLVWDKHKEKIEKQSFQDALNLAAYHGKLGVIKFFIANIADIKSLDLQTVFYMASRNGKFLVVEYLVKNINYGIDIHEDYNKALKLAIRGHHLDIVKLLISYTKASEKKNIIKTIQEEYNSSLPSEMKKYLKFQMNWKERITTLLCYGHGYCSL